MERVLQKLARQLHGLDEASLMGLWQKYADQVRRFEPSQRWEESVLILSFIQAMHFKNQLFNYHWAKEASSPPLGIADKPRHHEPSPAARHVDVQPGLRQIQPDAETHQEHHSRKVLQFPGLEPKE